MFTLPPHTLATLLKNQDSPVLSNVGRLKQLCRKIWTTSSGGWGKAKALQKSLLPKLTNHFFTQLCKLNFKPYFFYQICQLNLFHPFIEREKTCYQRIWNKNSSIFFFKYCLQNYSSKLSTKFFFFNYWSKQSLHLTVLPNLITYIFHQILANIISTFNWIKNNFQLNLSIKIFKI